MALEVSDILEKTINIQYKLTFNYDLMNPVMRIIKEKHWNCTSKVRNGLPVYYFCAQKWGWNNFYNFR